MNPKLLFFQDIYINMNHVTMVDLHPSRVVFYFVNGTTSEHSNIVRTEYNKLCENLQSME